MSIQDLGSIGEFVAAGATVATLVYLAVQIRRNTRALRGAAHETATGRMTNFALTVGTDLPKSRLWHTGLREPEKLDADEWDAFVLLVGSVFTGGETAYWQHKRGNFDPQIFERWLAILRALLLAPGVQRWWADSRRPEMPFTREFTALVERELVAVLTQPPPTGSTG